MEVSLLGSSLLLLMLTVTGSDTQADVCGIAPLNNKIVGGQSAPAGSWPWQASLHSSGRHFCGGSLINNQWILSAAHCFQSTSTNSLLVYLGRDSQQGQNPNERSLTVSEVISHPDYNPTTHDNDIALLRLSSTVEFTDYIRPICLAASGSGFPAGTNCWVTGWGDIQNNTPLPFPKTLQEVSVPVVSNTQCDDVYGGITSNMICAGVTEGGKDSCQGDSGGPMVSQDGSRWIQAGVVSFGMGCAEPNFPGVYARVSQYQSWIEGQTSGNQAGFVTFSAGSATGATHFISMSALLLLPVLLSLFVLS